VSAPKAILVGGANGAGKTTLARQYLPLLYPGILFLNADEIQHETDEALSSIVAGKELLRRLRSAETSIASFAVETTLASRMYIPHVKRWNLAGFETILHFIEVPSADFAVARVQERVKRGGHPIPEDAVRRRHQRGLELFVKAYRPLFDLWYHWKSDEQGLKLFATKAAGD
jgi:predicted ABC-type ATPase